ncbi:MAG: DUF928 domain-containing protein [Scytonematopsis contorta HA4267-MV1]|jgi:hypothetical protein|nr:DUF928 domain-containing protein [Scytonematopsis contorta HA4267-MV1]
MTSTKFPRLLASFSMLLLLLPMVPGWSLTAQAQQSSSGNPRVAVRRQSRVKFEPPKGQPAPAFTIGGGRRDNNNNTCTTSSRTARSLPPGNQNSNQALTALLPTTKLGLTVSSHPTFMVYVPSNSAKAVEFTLENEKGEGVYQTTVNLKSNTKILEVPLPKSESALEIGKDYKWVVSMICQQSGPRDPFTEGVIRRVQPDTALTNSLRTAKPLEKVALYAKAGIWFEAAVNMVQLRRSQPNNPEIASAWQDLLLSAGLERIASEPLN